MATPLPRAHFLSLPVKICLMIYEYLLVQMWAYWVIGNCTCREEPYMRPMKALTEEFICKQGPHFFALFYTNRQISMEAKTVFFSKNIAREVHFSKRYNFDIFTKRIGSENAALVRRVDMLFPTIQENQDGCLKTGTSSLNDIRVLQERCPGLTRLRLRSWVYCECFFERHQENLSFIRPILSKINRLLRSFRSLTNIVFYPGWSPGRTLKMEVTEFLQSLGWVVVPTEYDWPSD